MLVLLDSNILLSALLKAGTPPATIVDQWLEGRFKLLTCQQQIDEIRIASRNPKFRERLQPRQVGVLMNHLYNAWVWDKPIPAKHHADDPTDSFFLNLIDAVQADYKVTGDKRSGLLQIAKLNRTRILTANSFCLHVLHL